MAVYYIEYMFLWLNFETLILVFKMSQNTHDMPIKMPCLCHFYKWFLGDMFSATAVNYSSITMLLLPRSSPFFTSVFPRFLDPCWASAPTKYVFIRGPLVSPFEAEYLLKLTNLCSDRPRTWGHCVMGQVGAIR